MFKKVNPKQNFPKMEERILDFWEKNKTFDKLRKKIQGKKRWSFLDGPITANNPMGVHHAWGRTLKDAFQRYNAMKGLDQRFQNGFDCQGLWVEVEVEKELGFKNKKDIEKYGIAKFVNKCKERVLKYSKIQTKQSVRLGQWMDWKNSYYTMSDENNYAIWHFLKTCHEKGYLYKGRDSVPWCPRCGTAISQHEILGEEYQKLTHKSIFFKLPIVSDDPRWKDTSFLVWTTTPWTIPANVALAIHPEFKYGFYSKDKEKLILLKELAGKILGDGWKEESTFLGKELKDLHYKSPFDELQRVQEAKKENPKTFYSVVLDKDLVTAEEGTGIVHIAPGAGAEDFKLGKVEGLSTIDVIDEAAVYLNGMGEFSGKNAKKNPDLIIDYIKKKDREKYYFSTEKYTHRYPTCWRCKEELVWRVVDEWYIAMDRPSLKLRTASTSFAKTSDGKSDLTLREKMIKVAKKIKWIPGFGLDRELDWLKNMQDWLISKKRYWGLALPVWECECGNFEVIGSKEELKEKAVEGWDKFDPPARLAASLAARRAERAGEAGGNSPHRPWVDEIKIKCSKCGKKISRIPDVGNPWLDAGIVPFSTINYFKDKDYWEKWFPPDFICESFPGQFKNWFYSLIAMSTVLENINPFETVLGYALVKDEKGEEMHKSKGNTIWFDDAAKKIGVDVMRWMYCKQNPEIDLRFGFKEAEKTRKRILLLWNVYSFFVTYANLDKPKLEEVNTLPRNILDQWILSELHSLIKITGSSMNKYDTATVIQESEKFIDNLANWYVRRSRRRFWKSKNDEDKLQAYQTLYIVLFELTKLLAPFTPFITEEIYQNLKSKDDPKSVHLCDFPKVNQKLINKELTDKMRKVRQIVELGLGARSEAHIKVRQPLQYIKYQSKKLDKDFEEIVMEELNVKEVKHTEKNRDQEERVIKEDRGIKVALNTEVTDELKQEGIAREIVRFIQSMRKKADYNVEDRINTFYQTDSDKIKKVFEKFGDYIAKETLSGELKEGKTEDVDLGKEMEIEGGKVWVGVKR